jgi:hypothetical protein
MIFPTPFESSPTVKHGRGLGRRWLGVRVQVRVACGNIHSGRTQLNLIIIFCINVVENNFFMNSERTLRRVRWGRELGSHHVRDISVRLIIS